MKFIINDSGNLKNGEQYLRAEIDNTPCDESEIPKIKTKTRINL